MWQSAKELRSYYSPQPHSMCASSIKRHTFYKTSSTHETSVSTHSTRWCCVCDHTTATGVSKAACGVVPMYKWAGNKWSRGKVQPHSSAPWQGFRLLPAMSNVTCYCHNYPSKVQCQAPRALNLFQRPDTELALRYFSP